jgi:threonine dehydratase
MHYVNAIVTVTEQGILTAMREIWETMKMIIEPSAAVPYAAILERRINIADARTGIIVSGGNVDLDLLPWMEKR